MTTGTKINTPENIEFLCQHIADYEQMSIDLQTNLPQKIAFDLAHTSNTSTMFALNLLLAACLWKPKIAIVGCVIVRVTHQITAKVRYADDNTPYSKSIRSKIIFLRQAARNTFLYSLRSRFTDYRSMVWAYHRSTSTRKNHSSTILFSLSCYLLELHFVVLHKDGALRFGELRRKIGSISTKVLTERLRMMESMGIVDRHYEPTIPPQVTYSLTDRGKELTKALTPLYKLALRWNAE